ncbi:MAG: hypothetical protein ACLGI3_04330, partial [Actinomycetes bacterium]
MAAAGLVASCASSPAGPPAQRSPTAGEAAASSGGRASDPSSPPSGAGTTTAEPSAREVSRDEIVARYSGV